MKYPDVTQNAALRLKACKRLLTAFDFEDPAKWRLFDETVSQVRKALADVPIRELNAMIDEAVANVREKSGT